MKPTTILLIGGAAVLAFVAFSASARQIGGPRPSVPQNPPSTRDQIEGYGIKAGERVADGLIDATLNWIGGRSGGARAEASTERGSIADFSVLDTY